MRYVEAPPGWSPADANPFSPDGTYGRGWSAFCVLDWDDDQFLTGRVGKGPFSARFGRRVPHLGRRLVDFLRYENAHNRTVILSFPVEIGADELVVQAFAVTPPPHVVRAEDPPVVVHSTTVEAWESIARDGCLKVGTRSLDQDRGTEVAAYLRDEPPDYGEYVMLGAVDSTASEMVVASFQKGRFVMDEDATYEPGVRLYFDNHRIIEDGLGVRDGLHLMKVHRHLPLEPYLLAAVRAADLDPVREGGWTLRSFVARANAALPTGVDGEGADG